MGGESLLPPPACPHLVPKHDVSFKRVSIFNYVYCLSVSGVGACELRFPQRPEESDPP